MSVRGQQSSDNSADSCVSVPQKLWEQLVDYLEFPWHASPQQAEELLARIRQHFDGPENSEL